MENRKKIIKNRKRVFWMNLVLVFALIAGLALPSADPYTSADYNDCWTNVEQNDGNIRPKINGKVKNIRKYDVIFVCFPKMEYGFSLWYIFKKVI